MALSIKNQQILARAYTAWELGHILSAETIAPLLGPMTREESIAVQEAMEHFIKIGLKQHELATAISDRHVANLLRAYSDKIRNAHASVERFAAIPMNLASQESQASLATFGQLGEQLKTLNL